MKNLLHRLETDHKGLRHRIFRALCSSGIDGYRETDRRMRDMFTDADKDTPAFPEDRKVKKR